MFPLLCTFNILQFKAQSVLPDDGTCDMIFLDSLYRNDKNVLSQSPAGVVEQFLIVANDSRQKNLKTKMGLAFDSHSAGYRKMASGSDWTVILKVMWAKYKCSYYGALDGNIRAFDSPDKVEALWKPLSLLRTELVKIAGANEDYASVLGVTSTDMDPFMKKVADNAKDVNGPTHFVIVTHTSYSNFGLLPYNKPGAFPCFILPPLVYSHADAYNKSYFSTMLCDLKAGLTNIQFGLGVYDIDADADMTPCSDGNYTGRYNRLMLLRKLNDFMKSFTSVADCRNIK
ncbi:hypothetical protein MTO96_039228 [Rhipicephalus appendiculatus]